MPGEVPAEELLDVAVRTIAGLLLELREARTTGGGTGRAKVEATPMALRGAVVLDVAGRKSRAMLDSLSERLDVAEKDLQEGRRLQERVGALTDLVNELLLPADKQDTELLARALRDYRVGQPVSTPRRSSPPPLRSSDEQRRGDPAPAGQVGSR